MLLRKDNPYLFSCLASAFNKIDPSFNSFTAPSMTDEQLAKITKLKLEKSLSSFSSLNGIEKLPNLESLSIVGNDYIACARAYREQVETQRLFPNIDYSADFKYIEDKYYKENQISQEDLDKIYSLKKLKQLNLTNQRKIKDIDLSHFPDLEELKICSSSIESVSGLPNCKAIKNGTEFNFDFSGCDSLSVDDLQELYETIKASPSLTIGSKITFPVLTYARCSTSLQESSKDLLHDIAKDQDSNEIICWSEIDQGGVNAVVNSKQMEMATNRCKNIIRQVCQDNPESDVEKLSRWYRYICDNITYDKERCNLQLEKDQRDMTTLEHERLINQTRSMFHTLYRGKGVCTGVRNLFNFGANLMNITAIPINCFASSEQISQDAAIANHALSYVQTQDGVPYFLDPTWDLGSSSSKYFMLTKQEIENAQHTFTLEGKDLKNGISVKQALNAHGLNQTHVFSDEKAKN